MFGKTDIYYIRESIYDKNKTNLVKNEIDSLYIEELDDTNNSQARNANISNINTKYIDNHFSPEHSKEKCTTNNINVNESKDTQSDNSVFNYLKKNRDYVVQVENSPKVDVYERSYKANEKTIHKIFENVNEVNMQLLKSIKSINDKEKLINKKVIEKVREDIKKYQETNEIMDIKGNIIKPSSEEKIKYKDNATQKNDNNADMDEEEKNEIIKKLHMVDKKTDKYIEENIYFVIQMWLPDIRIDDTLILIDNIEKHYNSYDILMYYDKFKEVKKKNFSYDLSSYIIENVPKNINDDTEIECEHIHSYNNTYNKLNNYNLKKYTYTYSTNENMDTKLNKNEHMPPVVLVNTKKNLMVQEWECKNFKNRKQRNKSHEYTRIQRAFRPFSYVDLSDISCIYKNNYLQLKMKLSHRKYNNYVYPFFIPINKHSDELLDFSGYKKNGDYAWSFFWNNFNYDKDTDYSFLNKNIKINLSETKFEEVNKKKSKKIMKKILKETKGS